MARSWRSGWRGPGTALCTLERLDATHDGWLEIRAVWRRAGRARDLRADVAALVGSFAEAQTMLDTSAPA